MGKTEEHRSTRLRNLFLKRKSIKTCCFNDASLERKSIMSIPWMNIFLSSKYTQKVGRDAPSVPTWRHPLDRKKQWNRLLLGAPPLGGGWEGFPDEGVCPYFVALSLINGTPPSKRRERSVDTRRAFPCNEKGVSSHRRNALFVCRQCYLLPLSSRRGDGGEAAEGLV